MSEETEEEFMDRILHGQIEPADLLEELERSRVEIGGKPMLKHRYIGTLEYKPKYNSRYNAQFESTRDQAKQLKAEKKWWEYVRAHPAEYYLDVLEEIEADTTPEEWCVVVREAWYGSTVLSPNRDRWLRIFSNQTRIAGISTEAERADFDARKNPLTVYRGCLPEYRDGLSWSLEEDATRYFKHAAGARGTVFVGKLEKRHVLAYISPNGEEFEVIVDPVHVANKTEIG